jgi:adenylate cyclase
LFNLDAALEINEESFFSDAKLYQRSIAYFSTTTNLLNLNHDSVAVNLAGSSPQVSDFFETIMAPQNDDVVCGENEGNMCRRIRFTDHELAYSEYDKYPVIPLSELIDCNNEIKPDIKKVLQDRVIVIQVATLDETIDLHLTPVSTSFFGGGALTTGPQIIIDSIETLATFDHPRRPIFPVRIILFALVAVSCVWATAYLKTRWGSVLALLWVAFTTLLCFLFPKTQLWPVMAVALTGISSLLMCFAAHLFFGTKRGMMIAKYLPAPVRSMLLSTGKDNVFVNKKTNAVVLISDLAGYTTVTSLLKDPALVFTLINEYLEETTIILQEKFQGWLENYVGDLVCFYWPADNDDELEKQKLLALQAAVVQSELQQTFFKSLADHSKLSIDTSVLKQISRFINAGIGVSSGDIVMGNIGPENGVQKFSVLGDPLNLSSRIEGLTRFFNTEIMITDELVASAEQLGLKVRRIARIRVKGRTVASEIYALGKGDDPRFTDQILNQWDKFYHTLVEKGDKSASIPEILAQDAKTLLDWYEQGLLDEKQKTWNLTTK